MFGLQFCLQTRLQTSLGVACLVADITSSWRFCFYQHLKKSADFFNFVVNLSKQIFQSNVEYFSQNILRIGKSTFLVKFNKTNFLLNFLPKTNLLWNFLAIKRTYLLWRYRTFLGWSVSRQRHAADSEVPSWPHCNEATPFGEAHLVALWPEIAKTCLPCTSMTDTATVWYVTHFQAYFCSALTRQNFSAWLRWSNLCFAVSAHRWSCGMGKEGHKAEAFH